jgi:serine/threonine protein kinase
LEARLGGGGMGVVYRARDRLMEEQHDPDPFIALKLIAQSIRDFPEAPMALQRECKRAQKLSHPNIVRVFYFGRDKETYYLTMELLEGRSLEQLIGEHPKGLDWERAAPLIEQLCSGLSYAHAQRIVHSDIKPSNVFIASAGALKILDFGIAAPLRKIESGTAETRFNPRRMGAVSPLYSSLEMHMGQDADPRDDVFSAACVIYELLTGEHPYRGKTALRAVELQIEPMPVPSLNQVQKEALSRALALRRDSRTASIAELQAGLLEVGSSSTSKRTWLGAAVALAVLTGCIMFWRFYPGHPVAVTPPTPDAQNAVSKTKAAQLSRSPGIDPPQASVASAALPITQKRPEAPATETKPSPPLADSVPVAPLEQPTPPVARPVASPDRIVSPSPRAAVIKKQTGQRCESIQEHTQLGESLNDEDRAYFRENCE